MGDWRLCLDPPGDAAWNMAVDESLLLHCARNGPTLRLYAWARPAVSLGYRQAAPAWLARCDALGVDAVRRVSGGGTVLHAGDLTYAVVAPHDAGLPGGLTGSYAWVRQALVAGLRRAGLPVRASLPQGGAERLDLCFEGATGYEVELDGAKLVGSAQRRTQQGFLQHGSIRLADDEALYRSLTGSSAGKPPCVAADPARLREHLVGAFGDAIDGALRPGALLAEEARVARKRTNDRRAHRLFAPPLA